MAASALGFPVGCPLSDDLEHNLAFIHHSLFVNCSADPCPFSYRTMLLPTDVFVFSILKLLLSCPTLLVACTDEIGLY